MKYLPWALLIVLTGTLFYRERVHTDIEVSMRENTNIAFDLAKSLRTKYWKLKNVASLEAIEKAEGAMSAAVEKGERMALAPLGTLTQPPPTIDEVKKALLQDAASMDQAAKAMQFQRMQIEELTKQRDAYKAALAKAIHLPTEDGK